MMLFAHCTALTAFAVNVRRDQSSDATASVDQLVEAVDLDMRVHWTPTAQSYFARVPKTLILAAVREATGADAAQRIAGMKKAAMAEAAERLVAGTGWLPAILSPRGASVMMADTTSVGSVTEPMVAAE